MKINFKEERKLYWIPNFLLFNIVKLITKLLRNKNLWVFGAQSGRKYDDNSLYLFEYVSEYKPLIKAVWLTRKNEIVSLIRSKGYEAYNIKSLKGVIISLRAGVSFYTNGLDDFGSFPLIGGSKVVSLWHGVGLKKIYNETYEGFDLKIKQILDHFFSWTYRDISIATSQYSKEKTIKQFNLKAKNVYITGQPRNDIFKKKTSRLEVLKGISIEDDKKIFLYMPTYRSSLNQNLSSIINNIISNTELNKVLEDKNYIFVIKLHPKTLINETVFNKNFLILKDQNVISNQMLLAISDVLITDYSSCFVDFALLNKPIIFYTPDFDTYINNSGGIDTDFYKNFLSNRANNIDDLIKLILNIENSKILVQTKITNNYFEDSSIEGTNYCENIYQLIVNQLNNIHS